MRLKFLQRLWRIVHKGKTSRLSTTELSLETENIDLVLAGLVEFGKLGSEFVLGDVGAIGVQDINDHLLAAQERVADKFARAQGNWLLTVRHACDCEIRTILKSAYDGLSRQMSEVGVEGSLADFRIVRISQSQAWRTVSNQLP